MVSGKTEVDTLIVGAGQAGVAMSEHLTKLGVPHLVLERDRIAERWRTGRWDSLVANGPAWHDRFPGLEFDDVDDDAFASKDQIANYFECYAERFDAPIRTGVEVESVERRGGRPGFTVKTSDGFIEADRVVAATGPFQQPLFPSIMPKDDALTHLHSSDYRNPDQLHRGAVLVVGAGSSGVQIADELRRAGRSVYLSVGPHDRPPRAYRNRDFVWWLGVLGKWQAEIKEPGKEHVTIAVSGARGGQTVDFRRLANEGITLLGRTKSFGEGKVTFERDLAENLALGDENYISVLDAADEYIRRNGLDLPEEPDARRIPADPDCVMHPIQELDLAASEITSVVWATGFTVDFSWLKVDAVDENGQPKHHRGVGAEPGIYFLGLPWLSNRGSSFIWGVWHDAKRIADHIATHRQYLAYHRASKREQAPGQRSPASMASDYSHATD